MIEQPSRRRFLQLGLAAIAAPAVIRVAQLMPIRAMPGPIFIGVDFGFADSLSVLYAEVNEMASRYWVDLTGAIKGPEGSAARVTLLQTVGMIRLRRPTPFLMPLPPLEHRSPDTIAGLLRAACAPGPSDSRETLRGPGWEADQADLLT